MGMRKKHDLILISLILPFSTLHSRLGLGVGLLNDGEVGISATNRNFKGRMGSPKAQAYLASPAVVAASASAGYICGPQPSAQAPTPVGSISVTPPPPRGATSIALVPGFPITLSGEV